MEAFRPHLVHTVNPVWLAAYGVLSAGRRDVPQLASFHTDVPQYTESLRVGWARHPAESWIRFIHNKAEVNLCTSGPIQTSGGWRYAYPAQQGGARLVQACLGTSFIENGRVRRKSPTLRSLTSNAYGVARHRSLARPY